MASMRDLAQSLLVRLASISALAACACAICFVVCALATLAGVLAAALSTLVLTTALAVTAIAALALGLTALWASVVGPFTFILVYADGRGLSEAPAIVETRTAPAAEETPEPEEQAAVQPDSDRISPGAVNPLYASSVASSAATSPQTSPRSLRASMSPTANREFSDARRTASTGTVPSWSQGSVTSPGGARSTAVHRRTHSAHHCNRISGATHSGAGSPPWRRSHLPESVEEDGAVESNRAIHLARMPSSEFQSAVDEEDSELDDHPGDPTDDTHGSWDSVLPSGSHLPRIPSSSMEFAQLQPQAARSSPHSGMDTVHGQLRRSKLDTSFLTTDPLSQDSRFLNSSLPELGYRSQDQSSHSFASLSSSSSSRRASTSPDHTTRREEGDRVGRSHQNAAGVGCRRSPTMRNAVSQAQLHTHPHMSGRSQHMPPNWIQVQSAKGSGVRLMQAGGQMLRSCRSAAASAGLSAPLSLQPSTWQSVPPSPFTHNNRFCVIFGPNPNSHQSAVIATESANHSQSATEQAVPSRQGYAALSQPEGIQWIQHPSPTAQHTGVLAPSPAHLMQRHSWQPGSVTRSLKATAATRATWHALSAASGSASPAAPPLAHNQAPAQPGGITAPSSGHADIPTDAFLMPAVAVPSPSSPRSEFFALAYLNIPPHSASDGDGATQQTPPADLDPGLLDTQSEPDGSASVASPRPERSSSDSSSLNSIHPCSEQSFSRMSHIKRNSFSFDRILDILPVTRPSSETPPSPLSTSASSITSPRSVVAGAAADAAALPSDLQQYPDAAESTQRSPLGACEPGQSNPDAPLSSVAAADASSGSAAEPNSMHNELENTSAFVSADPVAGTAESMPSLSAGITASATATAHAHDDAQHSQGFSDLELEPRQGATQPFSCLSHAHAGDITNPLHSESQFEDAADATDSPPYVRMQQELAQAQDYLASHPSPAVSASQAMRSAVDKGSPSSRRSVSCHADSVQLSQSPNAKKPPQSPTSPCRRGAYMRNAAHSSAHAVQPSRTSTEDACRSTRSSESPASGPKYPPITFSLASDLKAPPQAPTRGPSLRSSCTHFPLPRGIACTDTGLDNASPDTSPSKSAFDSASEQSPTESFERPQAPVCPAIVVPGSVSTVASMSPKAQSATHPLQQPSPRHSPPVGSHHGAAHSTSTSAVSTGLSHLHPMQYSMSRRNVAGPGAAPPSVSPRLSPNLPPLELPSTASADWCGSHGHIARPSARYSPNSSRSSSPLSASTSAAQSLASSPSGARKAVSSAVPPLPPSAGASPLLRLPLHLLPPPKVTAGLPDPSAEPHILSPQSSHRFALQAQQAAAGGDDDDGDSEPPMSASVNAQQDLLDQTTTLPSDPEYTDSASPQGSGTAHAISQHPVPLLDLAPHENFLQQPMFSQGLQSTRSSSDGSEDAYLMQCTARSTEGSLQQDTGTSQGGVAVPILPAIPVRRTSSTPSLPVSSAQPVGTACVSEEACGSPLSTSSPSTSSPSSPLRILPADSTAQPPRLPLPPNNPHPCSEAPDRPEAHDRECLTPHQDAPALSLSTSSTSCGPQPSSPLQRVHAHSSMHADNYNACASIDAPLGTEGTSALDSAAIAATGELLHSQLDEAMQQVPSNAAIDDPLQHTGSQRVPQDTIQATPSATPVALSPQRPEHQIPALCSPDPSPMSSLGALTSASRVQRESRNSLDESVDETPTDTSCVTESYSPHQGGSPQLPLGPMFNPALHDAYNRTQLSPNAMPGVWDDSPHIQDPCVQEFAEPDHFVRPNEAPRPHMQPQLQITAQKACEQELRRTSEVSMACSDADTIPNDEPHAVGEALESKFTPSVKSTAGNSALPSAASGGSCSGASGGRPHSMNPFWLRAPDSQPRHSGDKVTESKHEECNTAFDIRRLLYAPSQESMAHVSDSGGEISGEDWPASARAPVRHTWHPDDAPGGAAAMLEPAVEPAVTAEQNERIDSEQTVTITIPGPTAKPEEIRDSGLLMHTDQHSDMQQETSDTAQRCADRDQSDRHVSHDQPSGAVSGAAERVIAAVHAPSAPKRISQGRSESSTPTAGGRQQLGASMNNSPGSVDTDWTFNSSAFSISAPLEDPQHPPRLPTATAGITQDPFLQTRQAAAAATAMQNHHDSSPRLCAGSTTTDSSPMTLRQIYSVPSVGGSTYGSPDQQAGTAQEAVPTGRRSLTQPAEASPSQTSSASTGAVSLKLESQDASNAASAAAPLAHHSTDDFSKHAHMDSTAPSVLEAANAAAEASEERVEQSSHQAHASDASPGRARLLRCLSHASEGSASSVMIPNSKAGHSQPPASHSLLRCISSCSSGPCSARDSSCQAPQLPATPAGLVATGAPQSPPSSGARNVTTPGHSSNNQACSPAPTKDTAAAQSSHMHHDTPQIQPREHDALQQPPTMSSTSNACNATPEGTPAARPAELSPPSDHLEVAAAAPTAEHPATTSPAQFTESARPCETDCRARALSAIANTNEVFRLPTTPHPLSFAPFAAAQKENQATPLLHSWKKVPEKAVSGSGSMPGGSGVHSCSTPTSSALLHEDMYSPASLQTTPDTSVTVSITASSMSSGSASPVHVLISPSIQGQTRHPGAHVEGCKQEYSMQSATSSLGRHEKHSSMSPEQHMQEEHTWTTPSPEFIHAENDTPKQCVSHHINDINNDADSKSVPAMSPSSDAAAAEVHSTNMQPFTRANRAESPWGVESERTASMHAPDVRAMEQGPELGVPDVRMERSFSAPVVTPRPSSAAVDESSSDADPRIGLHELLSPSSPEVAADVDDETWSDAEHPSPVAAAQDS